MRRARLVVVSELIAFNVFPESKNGDTIAAWVQKVFRENNIAIENVTGVNIMASPQVISQ